MPQINLTDNNHTGLFANITFSANTGGTIVTVCSSCQIPYAFDSDTLPNGYYYGRYTLTYQPWGQVCVVDITPPDPSNSPTPTPTITPTITQTNTQTPTITPTNTQTPTNTLTPTVTTTGGLYFDTCAVFLNARNGANPSAIYYYDLTTNTATPIPSLSGFTPQGNDIANTLGNFWISARNSTDPQPIISGFRRWDISFNPFGASNQISVSSPSSYDASQGLTSKDNNTLISTNSNISLPFNQVVEITNFVNGGEVTITPKFNLVGTGNTFRTIEGDLLYTTTNKLIALTNDGTSNHYIAQYDYTTGVLENEILYSTTSNSFTSIFERNNVIYVIEKVTTTLSNIYSFNNVVPYLTFVNSIPLSVVGATTNFSCNTKDLIPVSQTPTPTPTVTPTLTTTHTVTPTLTTTPTNTQTSTITPTPTKTNNFCCAPEITGFTINSVCPDSGRYLFNYTIQLSLSCPSVCNAIGIYTSPDNITFTLKEFRSCSPLTITTSILINQPTYIKVGLFCPNAVTGPLSNFSVLLCQNCYTYLVTNTGATSTNVTYVDCDTCIQSTFSQAPGATNSICTSKTITGSTISIVPVTNGSCGPSSVACPCDINFYAVEPI